MDTKLTLTIDKEIIERAKEYAKTKGRSLSELIEGYLKFLTSQQKGDFELTPKIKKLKGSVNLPKDLDAKKSYSQYLSKKHK